MDSNLSRSQSMNSMRGFQGSGWAVLASGREASKRKLVYDINSLAITISQWRMVL